MKTEIIELESNKVRFYLIGPTNLGGGVLIKSKNGDMNLLGNASLYYNNQIKIINAGSTLFNSNSKIQFMWSEKFTTATDNSLNVNSRSIKLLLAWSVDDRIIKYGEDFDKSKSLIKEALDKFSPEIYNVYFDRFVDKVETRDQIEWLFSSIILLLNNQVDLRLS